MLPQTYAAAVRTRAGRAAGEQLRLRDAARGDGGGAPCLAALARPLPADGRCVACLDAHVALDGAGAPGLPRAHERSRSAIARGSSGVMPKLGSARQRRARAS